MGVSGRHIRTTGSLSPKIPIAFWKSASCCFLIFLPISGMGKGFEKEITGKPAVG
ncbi:hypothetical protein GGE56_007062 [Rhizobium leguminosarum]|nr:hypothetical protein [Rhizobium sp. BK591]MBB4345638.1 hypothetical protein [Rhizobium leguminosarum]MBB5262329.1 hypothetical protein [Rhizobium leguminosarum]MBB6298710.1 hypothetical protein [Rhizobium leguminosarum]